MAFDWTQIDGYKEDMTPDDKLALLENYEPPVPPTPSAPEPTKPGPGFIAKTQFDKITSELAATKKQLRARMTEEEQREAERQAAMEETARELETLRKEKKISQYKADYLGQGYDEALAEATAAALAEGEMDVVFTNAKKHQEALKKAWAAEVLKNTPTPPSGTNPDEELKKKREQEALRKNFGLS